MVRLNNLESRVFVGLVLAITAFFLWMVRGFLLPVFWAAVFAVLFQPLVHRLDGVFRGRRAASAGAATLIVVLVVLVPFALLVTALTQQALGLYQRVSAGQVNLQAPLEFVQRSVPPLMELMARFGVGPERIQEQLSNATAAAADLVTSQALALGQNVVRTTVLFLLMLYLLFFFFRDGERMVSGIVRAIPMGDERERLLFRKFADVSRATVKGTLVVAAVQGTLGGILFWAVGIQAAVFWGVAMAILSLLPAVGPAIVWAPAALLLIATGAVTQGIVVIAAGTLLIGLVDNLLRPILVGRETEMPDYLVLLATLGGLSVFGLAGFVAGPIVAALFLVMWDLFAREYAELDSSVPPGAYALPETQSGANLPPPEVRPPPVGPAESVPEGTTGPDR
jgi:predicted PurR-regulated permease PerM